MDTNRDNNFHVSLKSSNDHHDILDDKKFHNLHQIRVCFDHTLDVDYDDDVDDTG